MIKFRILSAASRDLINAVKYYESQSYGLGKDFLEEFEKTVSRICMFPDAWASVSPDLRRCLMRRFPYAIFYIRENEEIIISGVADLRTNPENLPKQQE